MQNIINFIENLNWGTVPNWIGNVSVPIILWLMTTRLNKQQKREAKEENNKRLQKKREEKLSYINRMQQDLLHLLINELPINKDSNNFLVVFHQVINNNLALLEEVRIALYTYNNQKSDLTSYKAMKSVIESGRQNTVLNYNQIGIIKDILINAYSNLGKVYDRISKENRTDQK